MAFAQRGFGTFHLEATDDQGREVSRFAAPVTLTVRFTPQQLLALGIAPEDLTIFWFDERTGADQGRGTASRGQWIPLPTTVDPVAGSASITVDHFSAFQLSDGSSPSAAYLPSLQGWQVSSFTGAASYSYPIDLPAGPGGLTPQLALTYSSAATDGEGGMRATQQAGWVGKGWSLDTGAVALHKLQITPATTVNYYVLSVGGQTYTLSRGGSLIATPDANNPTHWAWRATGDRSIRVQAVQNGVSSPGGPGAPGRGASDYGQLRPRIKWQLWARDGTRYDFEDDGWWLWGKCSGTGAFAYAESNRWLLTRVTDPSANTITYNYGRHHAYFSTCLQQAATVDMDIWPTQITWAGGRYKVEFVTSGRTDDTQVDWPEYTIGGPVQETRRLDAIKVSSMPGSSWQLVREYRLTYDYSLYADYRYCTNYPTCSTWGPLTSHKKLTLRSVQRLGNDGAAGLPATTFTYHTSGGTAYDALGG